MMETLSTLRIRLSVLLIGDSSMNDGFVASSCRAMTATEPNAIAAVLLLSTAYFLDVN